MSRTLFAVAVCLLFALSSNANMLQVEGPQDSLLGPPEDFTVNHCTLRKAVMNANQNAAKYPQCVAGSVGLDTITFVSPMTVTFALAGTVEEAGLTGDLDITDDLIIDGGGSIIDGNQLDRVFHVHAGVTLTLKNMWIRNGHINNGGGGILVEGGTLNLENVTISGCQSTDEDGGAIKVLDSALPAHAGSLHMTNCTISGNYGFIAGAIEINGGGGSSSITNSTITGNTAAFSNVAGGVRNTGGTCTIRNSIFVGNAGLDVPNLDGTFTSNGYNIVELGTLAGMNPIVTATTGDQFGATAASVHLGALQVNGSGPPTHALLAGSIALDKGHSSGSTTDERGLTRPCDDATLMNASGGDGGDVGAYEEQVACSNTPPEAHDDNATIAEDSGANSINVLANDTDANSDTLTITAVTQGAHGAVVNNGTSVSYNPASNFFGSDAFTYTIDDGHSATATATVHVTVTNVNDPPVANADSYNMNQDAVLTTAAPGVLGNDTDIDGDVLQVALVANVAHGTLTLNANGSFTYAPAASFAGTDTFTYKANDGTVDSNIATVTMHIADTQPPSITAAVAIGSLWPPNHDMVNVGLTFSAVDNSTAATTHLAVYSDEDDVTPGGGDQSPDAANFASGMLRLRSERSGSGDGRVYLIIVTSSDAFMNTSHRCLTVTVPKSQSAADVASVNAQANAARAQCTATGLAPAGYFVVGD